MELQESLLAVELKQAVVDTVVAVAIEVGFCKQPKTKYKFKF